MKKEQKLDELEPTLSDVLEAVQTGFERHEKILKTLVEGQDQLRGSVNILDQRVTKTQNRVEDIADLLDDMTHVTDKNKVSLLDHERRIRHLERARA